MLVGAAVLAVAAGGGTLLARSLSHTDKAHAEAATSGSSSMAATHRHQFSTADFAAAPVVALPRLPASAVKGHLALPWRQLAIRHGHLNIVFASRPSCEQVNGVVVDQSAASVTINVLATNIVNAPNCDIVPKLKRTVVKLVAPLAARSVMHARLDATYWPTNPFDQT
jgi:hypothetical protein